MQKIIYNKSGKVIGLGNPEAITQFLLPTPPTLECDDINIKNIVAINGNHWCKIFVIIAKLCCQQKTWQSYRDNDLLSDVYLNFTDNLPTENGVYFVCGKAHAQTLGVHNLSLTWNTIDELTRIKIASNGDNQRILATPYLDYRQFPNTLIEEVVSYLTPS